MTFDQGLELFNASLVALDTLTRVQPRKPTALRRPRLGNLILIIGFLKFPAGR